MLNNFIYSIAVYSFILYSVSVNIEPSPHLGYSGFLLINLFVGIVGGLLLSNYAFSENKEIVNSIWFIFIFVINLFNLYVAFDRICSKNILGGLFLLGFFAQTYTLLKLKKQ